MLRLSEEAVLSLKSLLVWPEIATEAQQALKSLIRMETGGVSCYLDVLLDLVRALLMTSEGADCRLCARVFIFCKETEQIHERGTHTPAVKSTVSAVQRHAQTGQEEMKQQVQKRKQDHKDEQYITLA